MKKILITSAVFLTLFVPSFSLVYAQQGGGNQPLGGGNNNQPVAALTNPLNSQYSSIPAIITALLNIIIKVAEVACALWIIYGGFLYVSAQGNSEKLSDANKTLLHAVIGTAIILGANVILAVITATINQIKA
jgi:hypothetical protein